MRLTVDRDLCIGAGNCARIAPKVFQLDDEEVATVVDPAGAGEDALRRAVRSCPSGAIARLDGRSPETA